MNWDHSPDDGPQLTRQGWVVLVIFYTLLIVLIVAAVNGSGVEWPDWGIYP